MTKITKDNTQNYNWGKDCEGWHFLDRSDINIILEKMPPKTTEISHYHKISNQFFYITKGSAKLSLNHNEFLLNQNEGIEIKNYCVHNIQNCDEKNDLEFVLISTPKAHGDRINVDFKIRYALPNESEQLTKLAFLSKSSWGYPKEMMEAWKEDLTITPEMIKNSISIVASINNQIIGFWCRPKIKSEDISNGFLFIRPDYMGKGLAKNLWRSISSELISNGIESFTIEADPNAVPFYLKLGALQIAEKESKIIVGRKIPILRFQLNDNKI